MQNTSIRYDKPLIIKLLKFGVESVERILPERAFRVFYDKSFSFYRFILRCHVRFLRLLYIILADKENAHMLKDILAAMPYS